MKKLSIITVCYNEPHLERTCQSIINQTWQDFEWIVIDFGSNKETQEIWDKYKYRINNFVSEPNLGTFEGYNKGIQLASGKYINFMNAGDSFYDYNILHNVFNKIVEPQEDILYGNTYIIDSKNSYNNSTLQYPKQIKDKSYFIYNFINTQSTFIKKSLFDEYGYYDENYKFISDIERFIEFCSKDVQFKKLDLTVVNFDINKLSSSEETQEAESKEFSQIIKKHFSEEEIDTEMKKHFSLMEKLFSIKDDVTKTYKIITILGIHIKLNNAR